MKYTLRSESFWVEVERGPLRGTIGAVTRIPPDSSSPGWHWQCPACDATNDEPLHNRGNAAEALKRHVQECHTQPAE